ncbi:hypothetical protein U1Q18_022224 [Sarracenia purpurea var. burkii]
MLKYAALYLELDEALDSPDGLICCAKDEIALGMKLLDIPVSGKNQLLEVPAAMPLLCSWMVWLRIDRDLDVILLYI